MIKSKLIIIIFFAFLLISCKNNSEKKIRLLNFQKINSIFSIDKHGNKLPFIVYNNKIILIELNRIKIYNYNGEIINEFGKEGNGPGEFKNILSVYVKDNIITIFDSGKLKVMNYSMDGNFLNEYKVENFRPILTYSNNKFSVVLSKKFYIKDNNPYIDFSLDKFERTEKERENFYKYTAKYEPFKYDLNLSFPKFIANDSIIVYTNENYNYFKFNVYNIKTKKTKTIKLDYGKGIYTKEEFSNTLTFYNNTIKYLKKKYPNIEYVKIKNEKPIISGLSFRKDDLWISLSNANIKQDFVIFDKNFNLKEEVHSNLNKLKYFKWLNDKEIIVCYENAEEYKLLRYILIEK